MSQFTYTMLNKQGVRRSDGVRFQYSSRFIAEFEQEGWTRQCDIQDNFSPGRVHQTLIDEGALVLFWNLAPNASTQELARRQTLANLADVPKVLGSELVVA